VNSECASGFCATEPNGVGNDRCAPSGMVWIPSGVFTMGSPLGEVGRGVEEIQHSVTLTRAYFLDRTEVTQGAWKALSGGLNPSCYQSTTGTICTTNNANDSGPIEQMDWYSTVAFANARSAAEGLQQCYAMNGCTNATNGWMDGIHTGCTGAVFVGLTCSGYRLPSEAEWEFAARAGTVTATHLGDLTGSVTDCVTPQANMDGTAWWCLNSGNRTHAVGGKLANPWGLRDMLGNVAEFNLDRWWVYSGATVDPTGNPAGEVPSVRGGTYANIARWQRSASRSNGAFTNQNKLIGFRLARTVTRACGTLPRNAVAAVESGNATGWGACEATACVAGATLSNGSCLLNSPLGTACGGNEDCASGNCATDPNGTANDRCAPMGMNYIPAGTFRMGSPATELGHQSDETQHTVTLTRSFFIDRTETPQGAWKILSGGINPACFQANPGIDYTCSNANSNDNGPVESVDWYSVVAFANAKSAAEGLQQCYSLIGCSEGTNGWKDGRHLNCRGATDIGASCTGYRLPTEAEWEYAARAGTTSATYLGNLIGNLDCSTSQPNLDGIAWWCLNSATRTQLVGTKPANAWGLRDMLGNVREWVNDGPRTYGSVPAVDPIGPSAATGTSREVRGGSWNDSGSSGSRAANRIESAPYNSGSFGFRLVRTAP
jgi:formylglycine-generating enzyme required for sulfatase activity